MRFSEPETQAVNLVHEAYRSGSNEGGHPLASDPKILNAITAQGLVGYSENLMEELSNRCRQDAEALSPNDAEIVLKAFEAQKKAYAAHNLPIYLYKAACLLWVLDEVSAKDYFKHFLIEYANFKPNNVDKLFLNNFYNKVDMRPSPQIAREKTP